MVGVAAGAGVEALPLDSSGGERARGTLGASKGFHMQTLIIHELGFNSNYYTFALILLIKIVMCSKSH